jgi:hypothetical protein
MPPIEPSPTDEIYIRGLTGYFTMIFIEPTCASYLRFRADKFSASTIEDLKKTTTWLSLHLYDENSKHINSWSK